MDARTEWNYAKNCKHIVLSNNSIELTISSVSSIKQFPRKSIFRQQRASNQVRIWDDNPLVDLDYAIITHKRCQTKAKGAFPFVQLGIPNTECNCWEEQYSLMDLPSVVFTKQETNANTESLITIRKQMKAEGVFNNESIFRSEKSDEEDISGK